MSRISGFSLSALFSFLVGFMSWLGLTLLEIEFPYSDHARFGAGLILFGIMFYLCLRGSFVPQVHRGLLVFLGERTKKEIPEGINAWLPVPIGGVLLFDMSTQDPINLTFDGPKAITTADGTKLENADISIIWSRMPGKLFELTQVGGDIKKFITEFAEDNVRNAAIAITAGMDPDIKKEQYMNLDVFALEQSIVKWKRAIGDGIEEALSKKELARMAQTGRTLPENGSGLIPSMEKLGIKIDQIKISSAKLPDNIRQAIDDIKVEPLEEAKERLNIVSLGESYKSLKRAAPGVDDNALLMVAALEKGTAGINVHHVSDGGNNKPSSPDKIAAAIFSQNSISSSND